MSKQRELGFELGSKVVRSYRTNDMFCVRKALNDCIYEYVVDEKGFSACTRVDNFRILLGVLSVIVGVGSHVDKTPFPEIVPFLLQCIVLYHVLAAALYYTYRYLEGDAFLVTVPIDDKASPLYGKSVQFSSAVDPFEPYYTIEAKVLGPKPRFVVVPRKVVKAAKSKLSIGRFFDAGGYIYPPNIKDEVDCIIAELAESGKKKGGKK